MTTAALVASASSRRTRTAAAAPAVSLRELLHRASQKANQSFEHRLIRARASPRLTPRQWTILVALAGHQGASQTRLVEITGVDRSTLSDTVRRMLRKGLLQRRRTKEDARTYAVKLTAEGHLALKTNAVLSTQADKETLAMLSGPEQQTLLALLALLARVAEE